MDNMTKERVEAIDKAFSDWWSDAVDTYDHGCVGADGRGMYHMLYGRRTDIIKWEDITSNNEGGTNE